MSFGRTEAVSGVTMEVEAGTIFGLVGSDGAGKSTLLRMIATMIKPISGTITVAGIDVVEQTMEDQTAASVTCPSVSASIRT